MWVYVYFGYDYKVICPFYLGCTSEVVTYLKSFSNKKKGKVSRIVLLHQEKYLMDSSLLEITDISELLPVLTLKYNNRIRLPNILPYMGFEYQKSPVEFLQLEAANEINCPKIFRCVQSCCTHG